MAQKKVWIGSLGPLLYDPDYDVIDPDGVIVQPQSGLVCEGQVKVLEAPVESVDVLRLMDLEGVFTLVSVANIDDPSAELNLLAGSVAGAIIICYQVVSGANVGTLYMWDTFASGSENVPYTVDGADSGRWIAIGGKYVASNFNTLNAFIASLISTSIYSDYVDLNTSATVSQAEGRLWWNDTDKTLNIGLAGSSSVLQVGQEMQLPRAKAVGSDILNGQVVYISGASGSKPEVTLAKADSFATSDSTIAVATENVTQNANGYFTAFGLVRDINTSSFNAGDKLYLSASTAGALTKVAPTEPNNIITIGYCIYSHATNGIIFVHIKKCTVLYTCIYGMAATYIPFASSNGFLKQKSTFTFDESTDKLTVGGEVNGATGHFGGLTNYSEFESDGTLKFNGTATVYKDLIADAGRLSRLGFSDPGLVKVTDNGAGSVGLYLPAFIDANYKELQGTFELQHDYKEGTDLVVHVHWFPSTTDTGNVDFEYEYVVHKGNTALGNSTKSNIQTAAPGTAKYAKRTNFVTITGTGFKVGDQIIVRFGRDARVTNTNDTFVGDVYIQTLGIHYECDTVGSRQITTK